MAHDIECWNCGNPLLKCAAFLGCNPIGRELAALRADLARVTADNATLRGPGGSFDSFKAQKIRADALRADLARVTAGRDAAIADLAKEKTLSESRGLHITQLGEEQRILMHREDAAIARAEKAEVERDALLAPSRANELTLVVWIKRLREQRDAALAEVERRESSHDHMLAEAETAIKERDHAEALLFALASAHNPFTDVGPWLSACRDLLRARGLIK